MSSVVYHKDTNVKTDLRNPIYNTLFEIDFNDDKLNELLKEDVFSYKLNNNSLRLYIHIYQETNIQELINTLKFIKKINIKIHDKNGNVFNNIHITPNFTASDYEIKQSWDLNGNDLTHFEFVYNTFNVNIEHLDN